MCPNAQRLGDQHVSEKLAEVSKKLDEAGVKHSTKLLEKSIVPGQISAAIVAEANETGADLIVLGTHGRRGLKHLVLGSVVEGVVRKTNKPVLMVRSEVDVARQLPDWGQPSAHEHALVTVAMMVGTLTLARAVDDPKPDHLFDATRCGTPYLWRLTRHFRGERSGVGPWRPQGIRRCA